MADASALSMNPGISAAPLMRASWSVITCLELRLIHRAIEPGDEVYLSYGVDKCNSDLLVGYGFVLDTPDTDCGSVTMKPRFGMCW